ncbi:PASTA domain-containing protein [Streptomyces longwoodensis]|uniref:PASTA domain-containing protein n=1 Tax=Streptomyces longwoodensis TaxID=68231 RepID=UPI002DDC331E|nr:PASTA domain-containing protein [Streptomyces longwoodensis]WRY87388.1 PASTA domain-containing protein [Streptomyces longwoodensis]
MNRTTLVAAAILVALGGATACQPTDTTGSSGNTATAPAITNSSAPAADKPASDSDAKAETKALPNFVGMGLQSAQDTAQATGFYALTSHDSLGRGRMQAFDRNWKVCSQNFAAGKTVPVDTTLDFGAVKLDESCPTNDQAAPAEAGGKMPDFAGKSVKAARAALDSGTSITVKDATEDRFILIESNWQVCTQSPAPGKALNGQPVEFTAVKFEESCP